MKKKIEISGSLKDLVTYCTAIYKVEDEIDQELLKEIINQSPIFENKSFTTNVLGTLQKTSVQRNCKVFFRKNLITLQIRYEIQRVVDIEVTEKDETWIKNDVDSLLKHFELLLKPFEEEQN